MPRLPELQSDVKTAAELLTEVQAAQRTNRASLAAAHAQMKSGDPAQFVTGAISLGASANTYASALADVLTETLRLLAGDDGDQLPQIVE